LFVRLGSIFVQGSLLSYLISFGSIFQTVFSSYYLSPHLESFPIVLRLISKSILRPHGARLLGNDNLEMTID